MKPIAVIKNGFKEKFGVPRQSGLAENTISTIVFNKEYRVAEAFRGLDEFSHIWLIWEFSKAKRDNWSPTVRPPRLGGNKRIGVFATRSPFRPNNIGLSAVKLVSVNFEGEDAPTLTVSGADLMDGTPIFDIKPYLSYADSIVSAKGGFTDKLESQKLEVVFTKNCDSVLGEQEKSEIMEILSLDPRPSYKADGENIYGITYLDHNIRFSVENGIVTVKEIN